MMQICNNIIVDIYLMERNMQDVRCKFLKIKGGSYLSKGH